MTFEAASAGDQSLSVLLFALSVVGIVAGILVAIALVGGLSRRKQLQELRAKRTIEDANRAAAWVGWVRQRPSPIREPSGLAVSRPPAEARATARSLTVGQLLAVPEALITVRNAFIDSRPSRPG
jgi:hypothetical protein